VGIATKFLAVGRRQYVIFRIPKLGQRFYDRAPMIRLHSLPAFLFVIAASFLVGAWTSSETQRNPSNASAGAEEFKPPVKGETMARLKSQFDDPMRVESNSDGTQTWIYLLGKKAEKGQVNSGFAALEKKGTRQLFPKENLRGTFKRIRLCDNRQS
jgi:hypothetical protein